MNIHDELKLWLDTADALCQEELLRPADNEFRAFYLEHALQGKPVEVIRGYVRESPEYVEVHAEVPLAPIEVRGRFFVVAGVPFRMRGITGFRLVEMFAHGQEEEAIDWMEKAKAVGFNLVRVLLCCQGMFQLSLAEGKLALPKFLAATKKIGLYAEVTAFADTKDLNINFEAEITEIAALMQPHAILEICNEHYHATQDPRLHDENFLQIIASRIPDGVIFTTSAPSNDEATTPGGIYLTRHLGRSRDKWNMVRRVRELEVISQDVSKPVISGEPIGAAEQDIPEKRCADPAIFYTFGVLSRIFEIGTIFHCDAGLLCEPLGPTQQACAEAFIQGTHILPDEVMLMFRNATWHDSPVKWFNTSLAVRAYSGVNDSAIICVLGISSDPKLELQNGYSISSTVSPYPGVQVHFLTHGG